MTALFEPWNFSVLDVENLRLHYAKTCEHWLSRFEENREQVREMFDDAFVRAWRLYLSGCIANFQLGDLQLYQVVFARPGNNRIPARVLIEVCNLNNPDDRRLLVSRNYREKVAQAIVSALVDFYGGPGSQTVTARKGASPPAEVSSEPESDR